MSKVFLYVHGEDFSASNFKTNYDAQCVYDDMIANNITKKVLEDENFYAEVEIKVFNEVDDEFISFIKNKLCDYDQLKDSNIFEVEVN